jgi:DNA-binding beta-propeller fold protein YncE
VDRAGNIVLVSYAGKGTVMSVDVRGAVASLVSESVRERPGKTYFLPVSDWRLNRESLSKPAAQFISPDATLVLPVGADFPNGATSWGVKSSPPIRSFGLAPVVAGQRFYVTDEAELTTWVSDVQPDGSLGEFNVFAQEGGEGVAVDAQGNVYIAAGQIYVFNSAGKPLEMIAVPERPLQLVFGGADRRTLFIPARTSLYAVRTSCPGR